MNVGLRWTGRRRFQAEVIALACAITVLAIAPPFVLGALAVQVSVDLGMTPATLGLMISLFFASTALSSVRLGRAVQDRGIRTSLSWALGLNAVSLMMISGAPGLPVLSVAMVVAGLANGAVLPAANALLAQGIEGRLGLALGIKQAAMPVSTLAAGLAVPFIALTVGWRFVFGLAAFLALITLLVSRRVDPGVVDATSVPELAVAVAPMPSSPFGALVLGAALGAVLSSSLGAFLVDSGVHLSQVGEATAGFIVATAAAVGIVARVGLGWFIDGRHDRMPFMLTIHMLLVGALGAVLVGSGHPGGYLVGSWLAYGAGWGWQGLINYAVVSRTRRGAARATGRLLVGFASGSAIGPLLLGQVAERYGYALMWRLVGIVAVAAAAVVAIVMRSLRALETSSVRRL